MSGSDFPEGHLQVVLMQVTPEMVEEFFQPVPQELELPSRGSTGRVMAKL